MTTQTKNKSRRRGCLVWGLRIGGGLILVLVGLLLAGYASQVQATRSDFKRLPAPGVRVDIGGYSLHLNCQGEGSPTVVVDAGNGDFSLGWGLVQPKVAEFSRICTYDRAGYGWSDPGPQPRSAEQIATELHTLLSKAGVAGPYVLVGHSMGGYDVRMFAHLYPDEVAGMVLVDSGHPDQFNRLPPEYNRITQQQTSYLSMMAFMARFGILRLLGNASGGQNLAPAFIRQLPAEAQEPYLAMMSHPAYFETTLAEFKALAKSNVQVSALGGLGDRPLYVLTAGNSIDADALASIGLPADFDVAQLQQTWLELQAELAALSTNSTHTIVEGSPHAIQLYYPEEVIAAIRHIVEQAR
jgi:pimeloyl-ACP methyl ester carboxylesterase